MMRALCLAVGLCSVGVLSSLGVTTRASDDVLESNMTTTSRPTAIGDKERNSSDASNRPLLQEMSVMMGEIRQVAAIIQEVRKEHGRLVRTMAEMSQAMKDMSEHNLHIKKKVKKISKALNKSTHHHRVKDGFRLLQKDHEKILNVMTRSARLNQTAGGHLLNHGPSKHQQTRKTDDPTKVSVGEKRGSSKIAIKEKSPSAKKEVGRSVGPSNKTSAVDGEQSKSATTDPMMTNPSNATNENRIPDLVVDHPSDSGAKVKDQTTKRPESSQSSNVIPLDCMEVIQYGNYTSGIYTIQPKGMKPFKVWCDQETSGGGWTVIVARHPQEEQLDFSKTWEDYKWGFGDAAGEHWIGTEALHRMTLTGRHELRVNITDWSDKTVIAEWKEFSVAGEDKGYKLSIGRYSSSVSTAGDALKWHDSQKFSTIDRDNDALLGGHCARKNNGGWWYRGYRGCFHAHPTGRFQHSPDNVPQTKEKGFDIGGVLAWQNWRGASYFPKILFLMFRPYVP